MTEDRAKRDDETFAEWQFRVKPYLTARNKWIDENVKYIRGPIEYAAPKRSKMTVQAKMRCTWNQSPQWDTDGKSRVIRFTPVYSSDPESENYSWSQATPSGHMELNVSNPAAFERFDENAEYLVTFEQV
jgi:hypothetical protein